MKSITETLIKIKEATLGTIAFLIGLKGLWDLYNGEPQFLSGALIIIGFSLCIFICIYVLTKKKWVGGPKTGFRHKYSVPARIGAAIGVPIISIASCVAAGLWYQKVQVPMTSKGKIGIWVAQYRGDDDKSSAQRGTIQTLEDYIGKDSDLRSLVEVRELPVVVGSRTPEERDKQLREIHQNYNASIVVWGEIAGFKVDELHPMVALVGDSSVLTLRLEPVTEATRKTELQMTSPVAGPMLSSLPPDRIREPLQLTRYILGLATLYTNQPSKSAYYLEQFILQGFSRGVDTPNVYFYAGVAHFFSHSTVNTKSGTEELSKAKDRFVIALQAYKERQDLISYAETQAYLGLTFYTMALEGQETTQNLQRAMVALKDAAEKLKGQQQHVKYVAVLNNLGLVYLKSAGDNPDDRQNLHLAIATFQEASRLSKDHGNIEIYSATQHGLGRAYETLSTRGEEPDENLGRSIDAFNSAAPIFKEKEMWIPYIDVQIRLGYEQAMLGGVDAQGRGRIELGIKSLEEAVRVSQQIKNVQFENASTDALRTILEMSIGNGFDVDKNRRRLEDLKNRK